MTVKQAGQAQDHSGLQQMLQWQQVEERLARENLAKDVMVDPGGVNPQLLCMSVIMCVCPLPVCD